MKSEKELGELIESMKALNKKFQELTPEEREQVIGGVQPCDTVRTAITTAMMDPQVIDCE